MSVGEVDKVAEAICAADSHPRVWARLGPASKSYYRAMAAAAIDVLEIERERAQWQGVINDWAAAYAEQGRELDALTAKMRAS